MKASDLNKIEASTRIQLAFKILEDSRGIVDRDLYFKARKALLELGGSQAIHAESICVEDDS